MFTYRIRQFVNEMSRGMGEGMQGPLVHIFRHQEYGGGGECPFYDNYVNLQARENI
jgi:hypothetical protein